MKQKKIYIGISLIVLAFITLTIIKSLRLNENKEIKNIEGTILSINQDQMTIQDKKNIIYTLGKCQINSLEAGADIVVSYTGLLDESRNAQDIDVVKCEEIEAVNIEDDIPKNWSDNGIFSTFYKLAEDQILKMTLDEKIGQLLLVRYPDNNAVEDLKKYHFSGFVFFEKDFINKTTEEVQNMIKSLQEASKIPLLTAVDEEGGDIVRISSNSNLVPEKFKSPRELYDEGGFNLIKQDTIDKSKILKNLGINVNLAPVVDVSTDPNDYIYSRTLGKSVSLTSSYAKTVIEASKNTGVSYTLKHFPGYGNNANTHNQIVTDNRPLESILQNDLPPFKAGIDSGAEAILVSHNIVTDIDSSNPSSLSAIVHNILRNDLNFTGIIITDSLDMQALNSIDNRAVKAILAGNDLIITTDYQTDFNAIKNAINNGVISESQIDKLAFRVIAWKYYKGLMYENSK